MASHSGGSTSSVGVCAERHDHQIEALAFGVEALFAVEETIDDGGVVAITEARQDARDVDLGVGAEASNDAGDERAVACLLVDAADIVVVELVLVVDGRRCVPGRRGRVDGEPVRVAP